MRHTLRIAVVAVMVVAASAVVSAHSPAKAISGLELGYWWQGQPDGAPLPAPPNVPAGGLWVSGTETSPIAVSAVRFRVPDTETTPVLTLGINSQNPPRDVSQPTNAGVAVVLACPATGPWAPAAAGAWSAAPQRNCGSAIHGQNSADGKTIVFDLGPAVVNGTVDVVFVPGTGGAALPALPAQIPGVPAPQPNGFDVTFAKVGAEQVQVSPATPASADSAVAAPDASAAPAPDLGTSTDVAVGAGPSTNFNFAADAINGSTGTAAASQPSVNPGSLQPQFREVSDDTTDNKGYRALAILLLVALLWWAWRQAVPPRAGKRTIYDGPPATA
jgi:hypothetical protein